MEDIENNFRLKFKELIEKDGDNYLGNDANNISTIWELIEYMDKKFPMDYKFRRKFVKRFIDTSTTLGRNCQETINNNIICGGSPGFFFNQIEGLLLNNSYEDCYKSIELLINFEFYFFKYTRRKIIEKNNIHFISIIKRELWNILQKYLNKEQIDNLLSLLKEDIRDVILYVSNYIPKKINKDLLVTYRNICCGLEWKTRDKNDNQLLNINGVSSNTAWMVRDVLKIIKNRIDIDKVFTIEYKKLDN